MSYATYVRNTLPPASRPDEASRRSAARPLTVDRSGDVFRREAERAADESASGTLKNQWSLANISLDAPLQRTCLGRATGGANGDCGCERCETTKNSPVQMKLILSQPGDACEIEADRMAESIVYDGTSYGSIKAAAGLQRQTETTELDGAASEEQDEQTANGLESDETGRPKRHSDATPSRISAWKRPVGAGQPLPTQTRAFMESRFGRDFSHVRIHSDCSASVSAAQLKAFAYTVGSDIYFASGRFQPDHTEGRKLLAHELTHVVQQGGCGEIETIQRKKGPNCGPSKCDGHCAPSAGPAHTPICGNEACPTSGASSSANFIRHLDVNLTTQMVEAEMGDTKHATGLVGPFLSSPSPSKTPKGLHTVDIKCTACHTNQHGAGMGWFTSFKNGLEFGFHDSQTVAVGTHSHGCVRVPCDRAQWIHDNTASGVTTVCVHAGGKKGSSDWGCHHPRPTISGPAGGASDIGQMGDFPIEPTGDRDTAVA